MVKVLFHQPQITTAIMIGEEGDVGEVEDYDCDNVFEE